MEESNQQLRLELQALTEATACERAKQAAAPETSNTPELSSTPAQPSAEPSESNTQLDPASSHDSPPTLFQPPSAHGPAHQHDAQPIDMLQDPAHASHAHVATSQARMEDQLAVDTSSTSHRTPDDSDTNDVPAADKQPAGTGSRDHAAASDVPTVLQVALVGTLNRGTGLHLTQQIRHGFPLIFIERWAVSACHKFSHTRHLFFHLTPHLPTLHLPPHSTSSHTPPNHA